MDQLVSTCSATTLLPACAERAWQELLCLLHDLWPGDTEVLQAHTGRRLVHAVLDGGEPDVWLTWLLEPLGNGATRVVLHLDELTGFAPDPELDGVLLALLSRCVPTLTA
ncbi:MAG: hypothetical protein JWP14_2992 [Frankiales bacterium]|jgi:hypothetical protein|nr:hypothetical protein [Frankiales bacterium]